MVERERVSGGSNRVASAYFSKPNSALLAATAAANTQLSSSGREKKPALRQLTTAPISSERRRVWVRRNGGQATSVTVEGDDIVDDLKTKVLLRYPTTLLQHCDPADLVVTVDEAALVSPRSNSVSLGNTGSGASLPTTGLAAHRHSTSKPRSQPVTPGGMPPLAPQGSGSYSQHATSASPFSGSLVELLPDENVVALVDRYFPAGMTMSDAFEVAPRDLTPQGQHFPFPIQPVLPSSPAQVAAGAVTGTAAAGRQPLLSAARKASIPAGPNQGGVPRHREHSVLLLPRQSRATEHDGAAELAQPSLMQDALKDLMYVENSAEPKIIPAPALVDANVSADPEEQADSVRLLQVMLKSNQSRPDCNVVVPQINVLIVEDNVINQKILEAFMRRRQVRYDVANNGREAVSKWRKGGFHLILMDIQLPVMTGLEATKEIRRLEVENRIGVFSSDSKGEQRPASAGQIQGNHRKKSPVIIVALTASSASEDKSEALAAGCNDFLTKPVNLIWLEKKIIEWGCMQALIDFDNWKNWIHQESTTEDKLKTPKAQSIPQ